MTSSVGTGQAPSRTVRPGTGTRSILWLTIGAILLLVVMAIFALVVVSRELDEARESHAATERTREVLRAVNRVLSALIDAETAERGFVISGEEAFLQPYHEARKTLSSDLERLRASAFDTEGRSAVEELVTASARQFSFIEQVIDVRRAKGEEIAGALIGRQIGKRRMDYIRELINQISAREEAMLAARLETSRKRAARSEAIVQIGLLVAIFFVLIAGGLLVRHTRSRLRAEAQASEANAALQRSEAAYRDQAVRLVSILDNVVDGIITINESGSIESWSKGAQRLFGYEADEILRRNVKVLMPEPYQSAHDGYLRRYVQTGERRVIGRRIEVEALTKAGERIPVDLGISELRLDDRRLFIGIVRDISERLEVERLKAGFVSTVSHELRTPLTSIAGSLGLLAGGVAGALPPKASRLIDIAKLNCERLVLLINDILDLERAESGSMELRLEQQPLQPIVQQAIELNRSYAHNFAVSIELDPLAEDAAVLVDRDRLIQVLTNLLSNAAKFSPRGGLVRVSIQSDGDSARVSVLDKGPGISADFKDRIFRRFAQADSSDSRAKSGTGLGLSIAKAIMEKLGGTIGFESELGEGSVFYITLPVRREMRAYPRRDRRSTAVPHILICEDDPDIAQVFLDTLQSAGMRARGVPTAKQARAALTTEKFDIALIDLHLPDADGLELIAELRAAEATRALPIVVMTASGHPRTDAREISALELADWLQKPIDPRRLLEAIRNVLAQYRAGRARILHVEDDESLTQLVHELLDEECDVTAVHTLADAKLAVCNREYHLVILDIGLGDGSGLDILPLLRRHDRPAPPVILYSATEASREVSEMVEAALVKSRHSVEQLLASVRALALRAL